MTAVANVLKAVLPRSASDRLSRTVTAYRRYRALDAQLRQLCVDYSACTTWDEKVELVRNHKSLGAIQQHKELAELLSLLAQNPSRYICEIGACSGGTLFLLARIAHPEALLVSVDINLPWERRTVHARLATRNQRVISICGDSRSPATFQQVRSALNGQSLDFLFIDGDHAYEAVIADFLNYRPLVRSGGLIAFHDIVPDFDSRYGTPTGHHAGGVPRFWQEIKTQYKTSELIEDPGQDGFGIGIIHW